MKQTVNGLTILTLPVGPFAVNAYLLWDTPERALLIDPGAEADRIASTLSQEGLRLGAILVTHGHMDHISALAPLCKLNNAPVFLHPDDRTWAFTAANQIPSYYAVPEQPETTWIEGAEGEILPVDPPCQFIHTPGHTPGGVCFSFPRQELLFSGDTLFKGSIGRTDLTGSDNVAMKRSLQRLMALPGPTLVLPGHGPPTRIAWEQAGNPFV